MVSNRTASSDLPLALLQAWDPCGAGGPSGPEQPSCGVSQIKPPFMSGKTLLARVSTLKFWPLLVPSRKANLNEREAAEIEEALR